MTECKAQLYHFTFHCDNGQSYFLSVSFLICPVRHNAAYLEQELRIWIAFQSGCEAPRKSIWLKYKVFCPSVSLRHHYSQKPGILCFLQYALKFSMLSPVMSCGLVCNVLPRYRQKLACDSTKTIRSVTVAEFKKLLSYAHCSR